MEQETQARKAAEQKAREREKQEIEKKLKRELYPDSENIALTQV
jgi:hypothetical protein